MYPVNTDFRAGVQYEIAAASDQLDVAALFCMYFPDEMPPAEHAAEAYEAINRFYRRSDEPLKGGDDENGERPEQGNSGKIPWDFAADADVIQADFMRVYGLDLSTADLHWWRFMALLEGLYSYRFSDRVRFRVQDFNGMDSKQRAHALKMREQFAIYRGDDGGTFADHVAALDAIIEKHSEK